jgi:hypothetical protein
MVGSGIRDPEKTYSGSRIPDPGGKKVPDPGSGSATLEFWTGACSLKIGPEDGVVMVRGTAGNGQEDGRVMDRRPAE